MSKRQYKGVAQENEVEVPSTRIIYGDVRLNYSELFNSHEHVGLLTPPLAEHPLLNYYRELKSQIFSYCKEHDAGVNGVIFTSSQEREGTSTVAINLALSMCLQEDITPVLIDLSGKSTGINKIFSLGESQGIMDYLAGTQLALESFIVSGPFKNLKILPYGNDNPRRFELLTHSKMQQVLCALEGLYPNSFLIIDGPCLEHSAEISLLLPWLKGYVLVVRQGYALQEYIQNKIRKLDGRLGIGVVFNQE